ncbi:hypothetical protein [Absidia glauca]|uniref:Uncharacterized protein n=1 Tax=Absidia glauca TaxID=4829 RepID=A0A168QGF1_ABSGL|nr:hypothetical protein [Absidia glauca]
MLHRQDINKVYHMGNNQPDGDEVDFEVDTNPIKEVGDEVEDMDEDVGAVVITRSNVDTSLPLDDSPDALQTRFGAYYSPSFTQDPWAAPE